MTATDRAARHQGAEPRPRRLLGPFAFAGGVGLAAAALHVHDPHRAGAWGECPSIAVLGIACPLCGGLRAVNDLTNGHLVAAFWSNALFVSCLPLFALWWLWVVRERWRGTAVEWNRPLAVRGVFATSTAVMAVFTVVRNTPWGARLYP